MTVFLYNIFGKDYDNSLKHYKNYDSSKEDLHLRIADYVEWFFGVCSVGSAFATLFSGMKYMQEAVITRSFQDLKAAGHFPKSKWGVGAVTWDVTISNISIDELPYYLPVLKVTACATVVTFLLFKVAHAISDYLHNRSIKKTLE